MAKAKMIKLKLVRGLAGVKKDQIAIIESLGLRKTDDVVEQPDNACTAGKVRKIIHLIEVIER